MEKPLLQQFYRWLNRFEEERKDQEDKPRIGRPIAAICKKILKL